MQEKIGRKVRLNEGATKVEPRLLGMTGEIIASDPEGLEVEVRLDDHPEWMDNYEDGRSGVLTFTATDMEVIACG